MRKPADLNTQIEALWDGENSINERYKSQLGAVVFAICVGPLALAWLAAVLPAIVE
jgi:hypothetical protein